MAHMMLGNAAVAAVLVLFAAVVGSVCRSPAVRHVAWLLVLLKLVTPPLFNIPLPILPAPRVELPAGQPTLLTTTPAGAVSPLAGNTTPRPTWWDRLRDYGAVEWAVGVWAAGSAVWFVWQCRRIVRFRRRLRDAEDAGEEVNAAVARIARELGIANPPPVRIASGIGSPMLWGAGRSTVVLFPSELLTRLGPEARDTLLAHELAHFHRRDHWVRLLEFVATGLYWWHPAVWMARAGIEAAEEECCDSWVVAGLAASPRRYAEALLATVDFIAESQRPCLPPAACGANRGTKLLYRRLTGIMHAERPSRIRGAAALVYVPLAAALVFQPVLQAASPQVLEPFSVASIALPTNAPPTRCPAPRKLIEPSAWATARAPGGAVTAIARDHEVVLRGADGADHVLGPGKPVALAFAPTGNRAATAGPGAAVRLWDDGGRLLADRYAPADARAVAYTPDGTRLLVLDAAGGISVFDPATLAPLDRWAVDGPANSITCTPDGRAVVIAFGSWLDADVGWTECWSIAEHRKMASYTAASAVGATRLSPDGRTLVVGSWDGLVAWRGLPQGDLIAERQLPKNLVAAAAFSPDAGTLPLEPPPPPVQVQGWPEVQVAPVANR
ncbi:Regulatory sensor-transducer, BlaR1/MecR1 family [Fimbriiglobus ruber]|uniref:Regulatory sensor-transducer, BlaR1/MecR1 family n=1 Tax=Fimbriiglobus ruber TaxID=1908690 RepID=A0A225DP05_9BACT|nr:Regulatory sensor-transducer, BlaR1/MecR1 family [Fimbriiglobus ruber]